MAVKILPMLSSPGWRPKASPEGDADSGCYLYDHTFGRIIEAAPYLIHIGFYFDGSGRTYGGTLAAVYAVGFRQFFAEGGE